MVRGAGLLVLTLACGAGDALTGADVAFTSLYLVPISAEAWFGRRVTAVGLAVVSAISNYFTQATADVGHPLRLAWNVGIELSVFLAVALLVHALRRALVEERQALVTEHRHRLATQEQLRHAERLVTVGRLAAGIAHELGTPLNVVQTYGELIEGNELEPPQLLEAGRVLREQSESMTRIVRQLLDFARPSSTTREPADLGALVSSTLSMLAPLLRKSNVEVAWTPAEPMPVTVDSAQVQQVFTNLFVNAVKASPPAGGTITVRARRRGDRFEVELDDRGPGIAPQVLAHLFEPFVTTRGVGEGTGLGLAVAYGMVTEHGGTLRGENLPTGGARFTVSLPARA